MCDKVVHELMSYDDIRGIWEFYFFDPLFFPQAEDTMELRGRYGNHIPGSPAV